MTAATETRIAGRALNVEIATRVMGWTKWRSPVVPRGRSEADCWRTGNPASPTVRIRDWSPSTDIEAAFLVVEKLARLEPDPWMLTLKNWSYHGARSYTATFTTHALGPSPVDAEAESAPLAICLAALQARSPSLVVQETDT